MRDFDAAWARAMKRLKGRRPPPRDGTAPQPAVPPDGSPPLAGGAAAPVD
jgi:hypothetical protein